MSHIDNPDRSSTAPPPAPVPTIYQNDLVFSGTPSAWTSFDCGVGQAVVLLEVRSAGGGSADGAKAGTTLNEAVGFCCNVTVPAGGSAYMMLPTDVAGKVQIKGNFDLDVYKVAHWKCAMPRTVLHGSTSPTSMTDLDLGYANAICLLRVQTIGIQRTVGFRKNGETLALYQDAGDSLTVVAGPRNSGGVIYDGYVVVPTDENGLCEWMWSASQEYYVTIEGVIYPMDTTPAPVHSGAIADVWTDVVTNLGRCILLVKCVGDEATTYAKARPNGGREAANANTGVFGMFATGVAYALLMLDYDGTFEWEDCGSGLDTMTITNVARLA